MKKLCAIEGCCKPFLARGWCQMHYLRWKTFGSATHFIPTTPAERFWAQVNKSKGRGCWIWTATISGKYGQISIKSRKFTAHRFSWELHNGAIPSGQQVLHRCDNPVCVRPSHLFLGDSSANMRDMVAKGRHPKQRASYREKLNAEKVRQIRASSETGAELARRFKVDGSTIRQVRNRQSWRNI